jgi:hypothetical protein
MLFLGATSLILIGISGLALLAGLYFTARRRKIKAIVSTMIGLSAILALTLTLSSYQRVTSDEHPCTQAEYSLTPSPEDCVQIVILESDFEGENGSRSYTINITPVDNLAPYKMAHEYTRIDMPYSQVISESERMAGILRGMTTGNTTTIVNYFE